MVIRHVQDGDVFVPSPTILLMTYSEHKQANKQVFPPGFEPGTFRVLGERDNHYTTETAESSLSPAWVARGT